MKKIMIILFLFLVGSWVLYKVIIFFKIDSCIDRGGAWDYVKNICNNDMNSSIKEIQCLSKRGTYDKETRTCSFSSSSP